jgi:hypothetical protein
VNKFEITYKNADIRNPYVASATKWARDEKQAMKYVFKRLPSKDGFTVTKRGQAVKVLNISLEK